ncbi:serine acetyltransferase [Thermosulfuriphilus ammonigenes]|uniref:Serine acetyltransferase n=1 Tax=Thermosulfuriphilus ammonigenes TaxID=1936021 RepID=A0A6G7PWB6_9BACT|nr:serine O-acetyltransferase EpsC [Thermosulfuriphilus ammonigenes]MBA2848001.1 serine O-acetyltransferase [Thermosulfuriphilus ammonigenes]QIJ71811.1 serine acetyltransferase [Thermosulfuriphilus ammonigenes]
MTKPSDKGPNWYRELHSVVDHLAASWEERGYWDRTGTLPIPSHEEVVRIIHRARRILFPGYFSQTNINPENLQYYLGEEINRLFEELSRQINLALRYEALSRGEGLPVSTLGEELALKFIQKLPEIKSILLTDIEAALTGDPAAKSRHEIIFCYPGFLAISIYRMAHELYRLKVPFIPRIMTEHAHSLTGIDIHPGATIGRSFFIDHGTGVVIGETTIIGERVRIYQGVTLGALSVPKEAVEELRYRKRHPTIEDDVIIYSNATILGGETVIGARSIIGGNVWLTESVPPDTKVLLKAPELHLLRKIRKNLGV